METFASFLEGYKDKLLSIAVIFTGLQFFVGVKACRQIFQNSSTKGLSAIPFITTIVMTILMIKYAFMTNDTLMLEVNGVALFLNCLYLLFYVAFTNPSELYNEVLKPLGTGAVVIAIMICYSFFEDPKLVQWRFAFAIAVFMLILVGWPLLDVKKIINERIAGDIDVTAAIMGCIVSVTWLLYSVSIRNTFMIVQNLLYTILCGIQIVLGKMYPPKEENNPPNPPR